MSRVDANATSVAVIAATRTAEDEPGEHADREREQRVRRHDDPFDVEGARCDPPLERVERAPPPHDDGARRRRAATTVAAASSAVFERSQRRRVTPCVHAKRCVSCSSSRARSGAPTKRPASAGSTARPRRAATQRVELALEVPDDDVAAGLRRRRQAVGERLAVVRGLDRQACRERRERERDDEPERPDELRAVLPPRHPCHRSGTLSGAIGVGQALWRHVGEQELLQADPLDRPRRVDDRAVAANEQRQLAVAVALADDRAHAADRSERAARAHQDAGATRAALRRFPRAGRRRP